VKGILIRHDCQNTPLAEDERAQWFPVADHAALVLDYETNPRSSKSQVYWTMNGIMLRTLTGASPITTYRIGADDRITAAA
jgi:hypothetical protein